MSLRREHYTTEQQREIERAVREAMEVARRNAIKEALLVVERVRGKDQSRTDGAARGYARACAYIRNRLLRCERMGLPYEPFVSTEDRP